MNKKEKLLEQSKGYTRIALCRRGMGASNCVYVRQQGLKPTEVHPVMHCIEIFSPTYPAGLFLHYDNFEDAKEDYEIIKNKEPQGEARRDEAQEES